MDKPHGPRGPHPWGEEETMKAIKIERDHVFQARRHGAVCINGKIEGRAAYPDQLILKEGKDVYWIEF